jgi:hypothetical protein
VDDVVFEDPVGICVGLKEVSEVFRVLEMIHPKTLDFELMQEHSDRIHLDIWQEYTVLSRPVRIYSQLVVHVDPSSRRITRIVDLWNG